MFSVILLTLVHIINLHSFLKLCAVEVLCLSNRILVCRLYLILLESINYDIYLSEVHISKIFNINSLPS